MIGMHPLLVRKEVDGFIANRLQEAMWREALWLVHDGSATVQEVDDAVRYSFGLRRAVVGPFRMSGGAAGIRRYLKTWGPMLKWPWTKLTDVPELTDGFLDTLAEQSDAQVKSDNLSESDILAKRDEALVAVLQGLRDQGFGRGRDLGPLGAGAKRPRYQLDILWPPYRVSSGHSVTPAKALSVPASSRRRSTRQLSRVRPAIRRLFRV
ncbi:hypothetical protein ACVWWP_000128 [Bradyrhizobium sp. LM3.6]